MDRVLATDSAWGPAPPPDQFHVTSPMRMPV
jgi:hypothetical protein